MHSVSVMEHLNLPEGFGYVLLLLGLILTLAPWLQGSDFGILKIPDFAPATRRMLVLLGPLALAGAVALHIPLIAARPTPEPVAVAISGTESDVPELNQDAGQSLGKSVSTQAITEQSEILVDWKGDGCLYPAQVLKVENGVAQVELGFGAKVDVPPLAAYVPKPASVDHGARIWVEQDRAWTPGTVQTLRDGRALIDFDSDSHCSSFLNDKSHWTDASDLISPQPIGSFP